MSYLQILKNMRTKREMEPEVIPYELLYNAISHARLGASARNGQLLRYALINEHEQVRTLFQNCSLSTIHAIELEQAPSAFIVIGTLESEIHEMLIGIDMGIAYQIIREYLFNIGYSDVCIYSFERTVAKQVVGVDGFVPHLLIAIGKSYQKVNVVDSDTNGYFRNEAGEFCVNKILEDHLIIKK